MSDDWRVYLVAMLFGLYLGVLGGTRRHADRNPALIALALASAGGGLGLLIGIDGAEGVPGTSLVIGPPVAIVTTLALSRWSDNRRSAGIGRSLPPA